MPTRNKLNYSLAVLALSMGAGALYMNLSSRTASAAPPVEESAAIQKKADAIFELFNGSKLQRDAGAVLVAHSLNGGMDSCMEAAGYPEWDWSMPRAQNPVGHGLESSIYFAEPYARAYSTAAMQTSGAIRADLAARTAEFSKQETIAITKCVDSVPPASDEAASATPPEASRLRVQWWAMIGALDDKFGSDQYARCLVSEPVSGLGTVGSRDEAVNALTLLEPEPTALPM